MTPEHIDAVRKLIASDRHVTYDEIEASLNISRTRVHSILHDHLKVKKVCSRWIPHNLSQAEKDVRVKWCQENLKKFNSGASKHVYDIVTCDETWIYSYEPETKQQSTVWVFPDDPRPTKVVRARSASKKMIAAFFGKSGYIATVPLEDHRTINALWYTTICLPKVVAELRKKNSKRRIILHQDNASSHIASLTMDYLKREKIELMTHCPYSPDLAPNDYFLFPFIKNKMRGQRFNNSEEAVEAYKCHVSAMPLSEWHKCFENWFIRMQKCIDAAGEYFEKQ